MIESFKIESESEADAYLEDFLMQKEYQSMTEVQKRASQFIPNKNIRIYFVNKARKILNV